MAKYLVLPDTTRIPIDDVSDQTTAICYPDTMQDVEDIWSKLNHDTTNHQVNVRENGDEFVIFNPTDLHFNKIELEHCSTGLLMRIIFASSLEEEYRKVLHEKEELETAYSVLVNGQEVTIS